MAEQTTTEAILNVRVESSGAINSINAYKDKIAELNKQIAMLTELQKNEASASAENAKQLQAANELKKSYADNMRILSREIQNNIKIENDAKNKREGSLRSLRAELSNLTQQYDALSKADRENIEVGGKLKEQINDITDTLKGAEEGTQRYYRNVGNYKNAILDTLGANNNYIKGMEMLNEVSAQGAGNAFKVAGEAVKGFGKQLLALLANPFVAIISAIAVAVMAVVKAIKSSEENTRALQRIVAPFERLLNAVLNVVQSLTGAILSLVEGFEGLAMGLSHLMEDLPLVGGLFKELNAEIELNNALTKEQQDIEDAERGYKVQNAKEALEVAELKNKAEQKNNYTAEERIKFLEEANRLEETQMQRSYEIAKRKYELLKAQSEQAQNDKATNEELANLEADMYNKQRDYQMKTKENVTKIISLRTEEANAAKAAATEATKAAEAQAKATKDALKALEDERRKAEDILIELIEDQYERERVALKTAIDREREDRLAAIADLDEKISKASGKALEALKEQRKNAETTMNDATALAQRNYQELIERQSKEHLQTEIQTIELRLQVAKEGSDKAYALQVEQATKQRDLDIASLNEAKMTEDEKVAQAIAINEAYEAQMRQMRDDRKSAENEILEQEFANKIARMQMEGDSEVAVLAAQLEQAKMVRDNIQQGEAESYEAYQQRKLDADLNYYEKKKALIEKENQVTQTRLQVATSVLGGLSKVFEAMGEEGTAFAKLSKVLALAEIAINTGKAIAAGVAQAQSVPFPANITAIATTIATVTANIASAISTVKSAKFAEGGLVEGAGTATSDSIPAMLSNGESVMTAQTTAMFAPLLSAMNQIGGGVPIPSSGNALTGNGDEMLTAALAKAFEQMPSPVVSVQEITDVTNRVRAIEQRATL